MSRPEPVIALLIGFLAGVVVCALMIAFIPRLTGDDLVQAYEKGQRHALRVNPASEALERVCAGLWIDHQPARP